MDASFQPSYAGFWLRFVAYLVDAIVLFLVSLIVMLIEHLTVGIDPEAFGVSNMLGIVISWLYFAVSESSEYRGTIGKRVMELQVTNLQGEQISFLNATGRYFAKIPSAIILLIGFIMAGLTERKQALHDMMASTLVIRDPQPAQETVQDTF